MEGSATFGKESRIHSLCHRVLPPHAEFTACFVCVPTKVPESAVEEDICGFVLSVDARICRQPFLDEASNDRVFMAKGPQPLNRVGTSGLLQVKPMDGASVGSLTSAAMAAAQADHACLSNFEASAEMHKCALPEMRRLQGHFERWVSIG